VINFLNKLDAEKDIKTDVRPLEKAVTTARTASVAYVPTSSTFMAPTPKPKPKLPKTGRITYNKPVDQIDKVKKVLKVTTYKEVGEKTFDYFYERECEE